MTEGQDGLLTDRNGEPIGEPMLLAAWLVFLSGVVYPAIATCSLVVAVGLGRALGAETPDYATPTAVWHALLATAATIVLILIRRRSARRRDRPLRTTTVMIVLAVPVAVIAWAVAAIL